ncbi:MAG: acylphosphatase [Thiomargarita sp.]|nr:acylphosphatase [Thiomargarita sp.]
MDNKTCKHCFISGRVQGVAFRYYTRLQAQRLGILGWAKNLADGRVEVLAYGDSKAVESLCTWLHEGPSLAYVAVVKCKTVAHSDSLSEFEIG